MSTWPNYNGSHTERLERLQNVQAFIKNNDTTLNPGNINYFLAFNVAFKLKQFMYCFQSRRPSRYEILEFASSESLVLILCKRKIKRM